MTGVMGFDLIGLRRFIHKAILRRVTCALLLAIIRSPMRNGKQ
jgi:hypothetical protein